MTQYLYTILIMFMTTLCMLYLTVTNEYMLPAHKKAFFVGFLGEFFIVLFEVMSILLNGIDPKFKAIHFLSNYFGFLLTPILLLYFATAIGRFHRLKGAVCGIATYFVVYNVLVATKQLFFIDAQNNYHRGSLFWVYLVSYFLDVLYLIYESLRFSRNGFSQHKIFVFILGICFLLSNSIQILDSNVYITRITVIFSLCAYYAYILELTNLFDKLTGVLNQGTYVRKIKELKPQQVVVILDIDNFKYINDNFGHRYGNVCLSEVSKIIKNVFGKQGQCYRIGGDEFAIVLKKNENLEDLKKRFEDTITERFKNSLYQLSVSLGYSKYEDNDSYEKVIERADLNMYSEKKQKKVLKATSIKELNPTSN